MKMNEKSRNYGIDLLRIVAAIYVVVLHSLNKGGVVENVKGISYAIAWFIYITAFCAVDIFTMISGYCSYPEKELRVRFDKCLNIWFQYTFYGIIVLIVGFVFIPKYIHTKIILSTFFPVSMCSNWYLNAFIGMMLLKPLVDVALAYMDNKKSFTFMLIFMAVFCVHGSFTEFFNNGYFMREGYSTAWLLVCYYFGGVIRKTNLDQKISKKTCLIGILVLTVVTWMVNMIIGETTKQIIGYSLGLYILASYNSITVVLSAILYIVLFSKLNIKLGAMKLIKFGAPSAFSVYVLNTNWLIYDHYMKNRFAYLSDLPAYRVVTDVLSFSFVFVFLVIIVDQLRRRLFQWLNINKLTYTINRKSNYGIVRLLDHISL